MPELGKAYVQIVPSAEGISGSITNLMSGEVDSAGKQAGESFGLKLASVAKKVIAAAGIGKFISASLNEGGALQQSLGGVETLFKENADKVKKYAAQAYKTTGLSANEYMENVTGFSASLLQSLGGDTAKAAKIANTAMIDMADNSNKMGTSMESIQNAYAGFAKQNYTMLDNLKLGYGGTAKEMQRLLDDAGKLTGKKYDINNLADVYNAIHAVQGELGITGTTAREASETLQGSFSAMKASFTDLLGQMSIGDDIGPQLKALAQTASTWLFGNVLPMVGKILGNVPQLIVGVFETGIPMFVEQGKKMLQSLQSGVIANIPSMTKSALQMILGFVQGISANVQSLVSVGGEFISSLLNGIQEAVPILLEYFPQISSSIMEQLATAFPQIVQSGMDLITNLATGIWENRQMVYDFLTQSMQSGIDLVSSIDWAGLGMNVITWIITGIQALVSNIPTLVREIGQTASNMFGGIDWPGLGRSVIGFITTGIQYLWDNIPGLLSSIGEAAWSIFCDIDWLGLGQTVIDTIVAGIDALFSSVPDILQSIGEEGMDFITSVDWWGVGGDIINGIVEGIKSAGSMLWSALTSVADSALGGVKKLLKIGSPSKVFADEVGRWIPEGVAVGIEANTKSMTDAMEAMAFDAAAVPVETIINDGKAHSYNAEKTSATNVGDINVTINAAEGMNPREIAEEAVELITTQIRRGYAY